MGTWTSASGAGVQAVAGGGINEYADFPTMLAATGSMTVGRVYTCLAPVCTNGTHGTQWVWTGSLLRPAGGQLLWETTTPVTGVAASTSQQFLQQAVFAVGALRGARQLRFRSRYTTSAADGVVKTWNVLLGPNGNNTDAAILNKVSGDSRQFSLGGWVYVVGATTLRQSVRSNVGADSASPDQWLADAAAAGSDATVANLGSSAITVSFTAQANSGATATIELRSASIYAE